MGSLNRVTLMGNLGGEPDMRQLDGGKTVTSFSLATTTAWTGAQGRQEKTTWHRVVCWDRLAETAHKMLTKGSPVLVEGSIESRNFTDKSGVEQKTFVIRASNLQLIERKGEADARRSKQGSPNRQAAQPEDRGWQDPSAYDRNDSQNFSDDSVPF